MSLSNITLSAAVRQNLLSLQGTAALLATTQERLATGKKVNSALDNPTNFFTAAGLDARASDISNLLDSIGNGVQVLQAANTGITSLSSLVDTAKSIANQVLQQPRGYTSRATFDGCFGRRRWPPASHRDQSDRRHRASRAARPLTFAASGGAHHDHPHLRRHRVTRSRSTPPWRAANLQRQPATAPTISSSPRSTTCRLPSTIGALTLGRTPTGSATFGAATAPRSPTRCRRRRARRWSASTTRSSRRSPPRRRTRPSTASTC